MREAGVGAIQLMRADAGALAPHEQAAEAPDRSAAHPLMVPFTRAVGAHWIGARDGAVELCLPYACLVSDADSGGIDDRAIMALLDHACGASVYASLKSPAPIATLDLRVAFQRPAPAATDIIVTAHTSHVTPTAAFVSATAHAGAGAALATASATFIIGAAPGGERDVAAPWKPAREFNVDDAESLDSFEAFLGLVREGPHLQMPFADRLIGAVMLPALHGGAVASLLASVAHGLAATASKRPERLASISVQYLRAGRAEATTGSAAFDKRGARSMVISASAKQANGAREVARAQCVFVLPSNVPVR